MRALVSCDHMRKQKLHTSGLEKINKNDYNELLKTKTKTKQKKMSANLMIRERSIILTGPKSTIHYEYHIMSPIQHLLVNYRIERREGREERKREKEREKEEVERGGAEQHISLHLYQRQH